MEFHFATSDSRLHTHYEDEEEDDPNFSRETHHLLNSEASTSALPALPTTTTTHLQKEHMFEKIVTPSDVGKLNRLVIPKQHAEKYFPLDPSTHERGLLLNFQDPNGKPWRFRYSYWNSSQSYVMTKGWSRFVKEKALDAGDTVSFARGIGDTFSHLLFIDWKRRPDPHPNPPTRFSYEPTTAHPHPYLSFARSASAPWAASRLFVSHATRPSPVSNYFYLRSNSAVANPPNPVDPPVPMVAERKRVRLFGVNLELSHEEDDNN